MCDDTNEIDGTEATNRPEDPAAGPTTIRHDWQQPDQPSVAIVEAVAAVTNHPVTELPPLQRAIDTDALDTLLTGRTASVTISFQYADATVRVDGNGGITVHVEGDFTDEDDA